MNSYDCECGHSCDYQCGHMFTTAGIGPHGPTAPNGPNLRNRPLWALALLRMRGLIFSNVPPVPKVVFSHNFSNVPFFEKSIFLKCPGFLDVSPMSLFFSNFPSPWNSCESRIGPFSNSSHLAPIAIFHAIWLWLRLQGDGVHPATMRIEHTWF